MNRVCSSCATCSGENYETTACTSTTNRECTPCTACATNTEYETAPCSSTSNRQCEAYPTCSGFGSSCGTGKHLKGSPGEITCASSSCEISECCNSNPTCKSISASAQGSNEEGSDEEGGDEGSSPPACDNGSHMTSDLTIICVSNVCSNSECCIQNLCRCPTPGGDGTSGTDCNNHGSDVCASCPYGHKLSAGFCVACTTGKFQETSDFTGTSCTSCTVGMFSDSSGSTHCENCVAGKSFTSTITSCSDCVAGKYQSENAAPSVNCNFCSEGKAFDSINTACSDCAEGKYQIEDAAASVTCSFCSVGFAFTSITTACTICVEGQYQSKPTGIDENGSLVPCKTWETCAVGTYTTTEPSSTVNRACSNCLDGKTQTSSSFTGSACLFCQAGFAFTSITTACIACTGKNYQGENDVVSVSCAEWTKCAAGEYVSVSPTTSINRVCSICPASTFQSNDNYEGTECTEWTKCLVGQKGTTTPTPTLTVDRVCSSCESGQFQASNEFEGTACTPWRTCSVGFHVSEEGGSTTADRSCEACEDGKTQTSSTFTDNSCEFCMAGKQFTSTSTACEICTVGKFQGQSSAVSAVCGDCPTGRYLTDTATIETEHDAQTDCLFCVKGKQFTSKTTSCTICVAGTYQDQQDTASTVCGDCPTGRYLTDTATIETEHDAQTDCLFCVKGKQFTSKTTICTDCEIGKYQDQTTAASVTCDFCPIGFKYTSTSSCTQCPVNTYQDQASELEVTCKSCQIAKWNDQEGQEICQNNVCTCAGGGTPASGTDCTTNGADICGCPLGEVLDVAAGSCSKCPSGKASSSFLVACEECTRGKYQNEDGAADYLCKSCAAGKYGDLVGQTLEIDGCIDCIAGRYNSAIGSASISACQNCESETVSKIVASQTKANCEKCPIFFNQANPGQEECDANPTCGGFEFCIAGTHHLKDSIENITCATATCSVNECCLMNPKCNDIDANEGEQAAFSSCISGTNYLNSDLTNTCASSTCTVSDCCRPNPTCGNVDGSGTFFSSCIIGKNHMIAMPSSVTCTESKCTVADCCLANPTCDDFESSRCTPDTNWLKNDRNGITCASASCTDLECCTTHCYPPLAFADVEVRISNTTDFNNAEVYNNDIESSKYVEFRLLWTSQPCGTTIDVSKMTFGVESSQDKMELKEMHLSDKYKKKLVVPSNFFDKGLVCQNIATGDCKIVMHIEEIAPKVGADSLAFEFNLEYTSVTGGRRRRDLRRQLLQVTPRILTTLIRVKSLSDFDGDGHSDKDEGSKDTDSDGVPDYKDSDSDGDGILDKDETLANSKNSNSDADNDGISDKEEGSMDTDGDGTPDFRDTDADGDGILDKDEIQGNSKTVNSKVFSIIGSFEIMHITLDAAIAAEAVMLRVMIAMYEVESRRVTIDSILSSNSQGRRLGTDVVVIVIKYTVTGYADQTSADIAKALFDKKVKNGDFITALRNEDKSIFNDAEIYATDSEVSGDDGASNSVVGTKDQTASEKDLELGLIIGGVTLISCCCFCFVLWYCCRSRKQKKEQQEHQEVTKAEVATEVELCCISNGNQQLDSKKSSNNKLKNDRRVKIRRDSVTKVKKIFGQRKIAKDVYANPLYSTDDTKKNHEIIDDTKKDVKKRRQSLKQSMDNVKKTFDQLQTKSSIDENGVGVAFTKETQGTNPLYKKKKKKGDVVQHESMDRNAVEIRPTLKKKASFRAHIDEEGREYYHCEVSDKVQWDKPEEHEMKKVTHDSMMDPESRRHFYVNKKSGRRTWTDHDATETGY